MFPSIISYEHQIDFDVASWGHNKAWIMYGMARTHNTYSRWILSIYFLFLSHCSAYVCNHAACRIHLIQEKLEWERKIVTHSSAKASGMSLNDTRHRVSMTRNKNNKTRYRKKREERCCEFLIRWVNYLALLGKPKKNYCCDLQSLFLLLPKKIVAC